MAITVLTWLLAFPVLGFATGLRAMTPMAVLCWFAYFRFLQLDGTWGFWAASLVSAIVFTALAVGEWVGDKLPNTPDRTRLVGLLGRLSFGGLAGALVATGVKGSLPEGVVLGMIGAAAGTFVGFMLRRFFTERCDKRLTVAFLEDGIAVLLAGLALHMMTS